MTKQPPFPIDSDTGLVTSRVASKSGIRWNATSRGVVGKIINRSVLSSQDCCLRCRLDISDWLTVSVVAATSPLGSNIALSFLLDNATEWTLTYCGRCEPTEAQTKTRSFMSRVVLAQCYVTCEALGEME
ncbi:hypothetical protein E4U55_004496 [Claviceps digitariae]|nr:hypothetical protein E4U55_004496 [Claviceps digitariae]